MHGLPAHRSPASDSISPPPSPTSPDRTSPLASPTSRTPRYPLPLLHHPLTPPRATPFSRRPLPPPRRRFFLHLTPLPRRTPPRAPTSRPAPCRPHQAPPPRTPTSPAPTSRPPPRQQPSSLDPSKITSLSLKKAIECIEAMRADGLKPSPTMYHALVNAYAQRHSKSQLWDSLHVQKVGATGFSIQNSRKSRKTTGKSGKQQEKH